MLKLILLSGAALSVLALYLKWPLLTFNSQRRAECNRIKELIKKTQSVRELDATHVDRAKFRQEYVGDKTGNRMWLEIEKAFHDKRLVFLPKFIADKIEHFN